MPRSIAALIDLVTKGRASVTSRLAANTKTTMFTLFLIPIDSVRFATFGADENGHNTLLLFTDEFLIDKTLRHLPPLSVPVSYNDDQLRILLTASPSPFTHVSVNQQSDSHLPKSAFLATLSSPLN